MVMGTSGVWPEHATAAFGREADTVQVSGHLYVVSDDDVVATAFILSFGCIII